MLHPPVTDGEELAVMVICCSRSVLHPPVTDGEELAVFNSEIPMEGVWD